MRINKQLIKLVYNDEKNLHKFLAAAKVSIVCLQWKIQNVYLWEIITFDLFSYKSTKMFSADKQATH